MPLACSHPLQPAGDGSGKEHCVWQSLVLCDGTMVTGDSNGNVQFWDAQLGTRTAAFKVHAADVLALAASPDGNAVFAAGVDPQLALYKRVPGSKGELAFSRSFAAKHYVMPST